MCIEEEDDDWTLPTYEVDDFDPDTIRVPTMLARQRDMIRREYPRDLVMREIEIITKAAIEARRFLPKRRCPPIMSDVLYWIPAGKFYATILPTWKEDTTTPAYDRWHEFLDMLMMWLNYIETFHNPSHQLQIRYDVHPHTSYVHTTVLLMAHAEFRESTFNEHALADIDDGYLYNIAVFMIAAPRMHPHCASEYQPNQLYSHDLEHSTLMNNRWSNYIHDTGKSMKYWLQHSPLFALWKTRAQMEPLTAELVHKYTFVTLHEFIYKFDEAIQLKNVGAVFRHILSMGQVESYFFQDFLYLLCPESLRDEVFVPYYEDATKVCSFTRDNIAFLSERNLHMFRVKVSRDKELDYYEFQSFFDRLCVDPQTPIPSFEAYFHSIVGKKRKY